MPREKKSKEEEKKNSDETKISTEYMRKGMEPLSGDLNEIDSPFMVMTPEGWRKIKISRGKILY
jgi:hypothetical protein